jgi:hypothetical protein
VDLLLHQNHFKLFIKNSMEQNGYQFHSTRIAKDLNILYDFFFGKQTYLQSSVKQSKRDNSSQIIKKKL